MSIYQCYQLMNNFEFIKTKFNQQNRNFKGKERIENTRINHSFPNKFINLNLEGIQSVEQNSSNWSLQIFFYPKKTRTRNLSSNNEKVINQWNSFSRNVSSFFFSLRRNFATRHSMRINRLDEQINKSMRVFLVFILHSFRTLFSFLLVIDKGGSVELISRKLSSPLAMRKTRTQNLPASREELSHCFRIYSFEQKLIVNCVLLTPSLDVIGN